MKTTLKYIGFAAYVCLVANCANGADFSGFDSKITEVITNATPAMAVPAGWSYACEPGVYFWNGFKYFFLAGLVTMGLTWVRRLIGATPNETQ